MNILYTGLDGEMWRLSGELWWLNGATVYGVFSGEMGSLNQDMWYNSLVGDVVVLFWRFFGQV